MYGGKLIAEGDAVFLFASEYEGGQGQIAPDCHFYASYRERGIARQTPRLSLTIRRTARETPVGAKRDSNISPTGMTAGQGLSLVSNSIGRQRNKIVGISDKAAAFLSEFYYVLAIQPEPGRLHQAAASGPGGGRMRPR